MRLYHRGSRMGRAGRTGLAGHAAHIGRAARVFAIVLFAGVFGAGTGLYADAHSSDQAIVGDWTGALKVGAASLRIVFHIEVSETGYSATMDSPDQGAKGIPVSSVKFDGANLNLTVSSVGGSYTGTLGTSGNAIKGSWKQSGMSFELNLIKSAPGQSAQSTPQIALPATPAATPAAPVQPSTPTTDAQAPSQATPSYITRDVAFDSSAPGVRLAGTLTLPQGQGTFPAVILVTGSGPQNRDEEILGHKPFLVIADYLAQRGIASLRWDDRGVAGSTGTFQTATTLDFADDAQAAIDFLAAQPGINDKELGVIGHSAGGLIAAILGARSATRTQVPKLAFLVMLAGPGVRGDQLLLMQNAALGRASGMTEAQIEAANAVNNELYSIAMSQGDPAALHAQIVNALNLAIDKASGLSQAQKEAQRAQVSVEADQLLTPWMRTFLALDPAEYLKQVTVPVLALDGTKDLQVPATENLAAIAKALKSGGDSAVTTVDFEGLNHLFQHATTGLPSEYGTIKEDFAPEALEAMGDWILKVANK